MAREPAAWPGVPAEAARAVIRPLSIRTQRSRQRTSLCYLYSVYGSKVLSGQQETSWSNPQADIDYYVSTVGKHPAILGGDYLYTNGTTSRAQAYWAAGGISMMRYHMGAPPLSDTHDRARRAPCRTSTI